MYVTFHGAVPVRAMLNAGWLPPAQTVWLPEIAAVGSGFTVADAVIGEPVQPLPVGVIVNVVVTGVLVVLVKVPLILPVPLAAIPVTAALLSLVQLKVAPTVLLVKLIGTIAKPEHIDCEGTEAVAVGAGLTTTTALLVQLPEVGLKVNVTYCGVVVAFVRAPLIAPDPLAAIPVTFVVLLLVQALPLVIEMLDILAPEQTVCEAGVPDTETDDVVTVTVEVMAVPAQPLRLGVIVNVTVVFEVRLVLVNAPLISPVPLEAMPVTVDVAFLVQL